MRDRVIVDNMYEFQYKIEVVITSHNFEKLYTENKFYLQVIIASKTPEGRSATLKIQE